MADHFGSFLASWKQLSIADRRKGIETFTKKSKVEVDLKTSNTLNFDCAECPSTVYSGVQLYSYYSYLYYYPTMHWTLDRTPLDDTYWVGIFKIGASDKDYITYQWIYKAAKGSYYCGQLGATKGMASIQRYDEFELRIFRGTQRLKAETNKLRGVVTVAPTDPFASDVSQLLADRDSLRPDPDMLALFKDPENPFSEFQGPSSQKMQDSLPPHVLSSLEGSQKSWDSHAPSSLKDFQKMWDTFAPHHQQLLFPILEQSALPDEIIKPEPQNTDWPEPKIRFAELGQSNGADQDEALLSLPCDIKAIMGIPTHSPLDKLPRGGGQSNPNIAEHHHGPEKIVLTIMVKYAYSYVYPRVCVKREVPRKNAWVGVYYPQSNLCFNPDSYIGHNWAWVGTGYAGTYSLSNIKEYAEGPLDKLYIGAIFDNKTQSGLAAFTIEAAISATPALPPATFKPDFDPVQALRYAELSSLAYKSYSEVKERLPEFKLVPEMQIHDSSTDTNGFIASDDKSVVVAFRGTSSITNFLTDIRFYKAKADSDGECLAHSGFVKAINTVYDSIESYLKPYLGKKKLFITGHSLGGALATLTTYRISRKWDYAEPIQFVYGCPPMGDIKLANHFRRLDSNTITIQNDPVSSGMLVSYGPWIGLYKPYEVKFLPSAAWHYIDDYIKQLKELAPTLPSKSIQVTIKVGRETKVYFM